MEVSGKKEILNYILYWYFSPNMIWPEATAKMGFILLLLERIQRSVKVAFIGMTLYKRGDQPVRQCVPWEKWSNDKSLMGIPECTKAASVG